MFMMCVILNQYSHFRSSILVLDPYVASNRWTEVIPSHDPQYSCKQPVVPRSRYGHSLCYYDGKVYMYGGRNDDDGCFRDVVSYDIGKQ